MKKVLYASTALVATAGFAAADVSLSGRAEMGIFGGTGIETQFFTDIDVTFTMSGETDGGLSFGAAVDLDEGGTGAPAVANNADDGGIAIFISGGFGTLTMGDTDGALDWALTEAGNVSNGGSIADDETAHSGYLGSYGDGQYDGQIVRYDNTFGDFGVAISVEQDDTGATSNGYAIGFKYSADLGGTTVNFGLGYQRFVEQATSTTGVFGPTGAGGAAYSTGDQVSIIGVSATATFGDFSAGIQYSDWSNNNTGANTGLDVKHTGIGLGYSANGLTVHANYGVYDVSAGTAAAGGKWDGYGLSVAYDLGGGAVVHAGYGSSSNGPTAASTNTFSIGLGLSF